MYVMAVVLPAVQAHFQVDRGLASMPYTLTMLGVGVGGLLMGRMADRSASCARCCWAASAWAGLHRRRAGAQHLVLHGGALPADRPAGDGLYLLGWWPTPRCVPQAARHRRGGMRQRQLSGWRDLAAHRPAFRRQRRLAADLHRPGHRLR
jgi:hypothetical protein